MTSVQVTRSASLVQVTATRPQVAVGTPSVVAHNALTNRSDADAHPTSAITGLDAAIALKAPLSSPALTGVPTAPTAAADTSTTQIATTAFAKAEADAAQAASDPAGSAASAQAFAIQRANHTGTQLAATISDFASAALAATAAAYQPLDADLTGLAGDYAAATKTLTCNEVQAATSAGLILKASNGTTVATIGAGPGTGVTFAGGVVMAGALSGVTTLTASDTFTSTLGTITTAKSVLSGSATWNNAAVSFRGISLAVTNTASAASSRILSLSVAGAGVFDVTPGGAMVFLGTSNDWPDATADTAGVILRTGSSGSAPFNQAGSILYRARLSDVVGRGSHVFYTGATPTERVRIAESGTVTISGGGALPAVGPTQIALSAGGIACGAGVTCTTLTASGNARADIGRFGDNLTDAKEVVIGWTGSAYSIQAIQQNVGFRTLSLNPSGGTVACGAGLTCTTLSVAAADYIYLRGDASTDGSVRFSSQSAGTMLIEKRDSGSWVSIGSFA